MRSAATALTLLLLLVTGCWRPEPIPDGHAFVPLVARGPAGAPDRWRTEVTVTAPSGKPATLVAARWPPDRSESETEALTVGAGQAVRIPFRGPERPGVSSLWLTSPGAFEVRANLEGVSAGAPFSLGLPVLRREALARAGETLVCGRFDPQGPGRSFLGFTVPWTERDRVPFTVDVSFDGPDGRILRSLRQTLPGLPLLLEDPAYHYTLPRVPFDVRVTVVRSARGRPPDVGLWVYGLQVGGRPGEARLLPTRLYRPSPAS